MSSLQRLAYLNYFGTIRVCCIRAISLGINLCHGVVKLVVLLIIYLVLLLNNMEGFIGLNYIRQPLDVLHPAYLLHEEVNTALPQFI